MRPYERRTKQAARVAQIARTDQFVVRNIRDSSAGPTSYPIKRRDPETAELIERALIARGMIP